MWLPGSPRKFSYTSFKMCIRDRYKAGDKIYVLNREKAVILAVIGKSNISNGVNLTAAHIDSPRLDLKQNPLYESDELGYFKTHYYGGIKKYQWPTVPMSLHGVIVRADGSKVTVRIGAVSYTHLFLPISLSATEITTAIPLERNFAHSFLFSPSLLRILMTSPACSPL